MKNHPLFPALTGLLLLLALAACDAKTKPVDSCGDGFVDPGEECDLAELQGASCASLQYHRVEGVLRCGGDCRYDPSDCGGTRCGDGMLQSTFGEECDGADLGSQTCVGLGYQGGALACSSSCHLDVSGCENACGDGVIQAANEDCEANDLNGATCQSLGFYTGILACGADCRFDLTPCAGRCGDGVLDTLHQEECDGANLDARTCVSLGYHPGTLACTNDCRFDLAGCPGRCGDGVIQAGFETCEGADLDGETCASQGNTHGGILACAADCRFDFSGCNGSCGDGVAQPAFGEACDGTDLQGRATCGDFDYFNAALVPTVLSCDAACEFVIDGCTDFYQWGSASHDHPQTLGRDATGNFYIQGYTFGSLTGTPNAGGQDVFVAKRAPDGSPLWTLQWGTAGNDTPSRAVTDAAGNTTVFGHTGASMDGQPNLGAEDFFLTRLGPDGAKTWTVMWGTAGSEQGFGLCAGAPGVVFAAGSTNQALAGMHQGNFDAYLSKHGGIGDILWNRQWGTPQDDSANGVAMGPDGSIYVVGNTTGTFPMNTSAGGNDAFLSKFDALGEWLWTRQWGSAGSDTGYNVVVDASHVIYVSGYTNGEMVPGGLAGGFDVFLTSFYSDGSQGWTRQWGTAQHDFGWGGLRLDSTGAVYVTGETWGDLDGQINAGSADLFVTKFLPDGTKSWTRLWGDAVDDLGRDLAVGSDGRIHVLGKTSGVLAPGGGGGWDVVLFRFTE